MSNHESNNPPLPDPNLDAFEATMIHAQNPPRTQLNEPQCTCTGDSPFHDDDCPLRKSWRHAPGYIDNLRQLGAGTQVIEAAEKAAREIASPQLAPPIKNRARPRRGPVREPIFHRDDYRPALIIIALSFPVGFLGAVLGILLMGYI